MSPKINNIGFGAQGLVQKSRKHRNEGSEGSEGSGVLTVTEPSETFWECTESTIELEKYVC